MICQVTAPLIEYSQEYFYGVSLLIASAINIVLACMLFFDSKNYLYAETPRYLRSRRLSALSLLVFGIGFFLHWLFMPHYTNLLVGKALSFSYFHIGGVLFSMSHTGLIDRHYFCRRVVVRDVSVLLLSLVVYWINAFIGNIVLTYVGSILFFLHISYLTWIFYYRFTHIYKQLGRFADYLPNDTDHEVLWLHYSCHLIITFGIGGMVCTVLFHDATLPFTILLCAGIFVFCYIYKALDSFGAIANEAESNLRESEEFVNNELSGLADEDSEGRKVEAQGLHELPDGVVQKEFYTDEVKTRIDQWVAERRYTYSRLTLTDVLQQMDVTEHALNYYIERNTPVSGFRQWLVFLRVEEAKRQMLLHPNYSIQIIADACGYANSSALSRSFKSFEGIPPLEWLNSKR